MTVQKRKLPVGGCSAPGAKVAKHRASICTFPDLPEEIIASVTSHLSNTDLCNLCAVSKSFQTAIEQVLYKRDTVREFSSSLLWSAIHNRPATTRKAISAGAKINAAKPNPNNNPFIFQLKKTSYHSECGSRPLVPSSYLNQNALYIAACLGHVEVVKILLSNGATPDWKTPGTDCMTPASAAAAEGHAQVLEHMHEFGYERFGDTCFLGTVLQRAVHHHRLSVVHFLVKAVWNATELRRGLIRGALVTSVAVHSTPSLRNLLNLSPSKDNSVGEALSQAIERSCRSCACIILASNKVPWSYTTRFGSSLIVQTIHEDKPEILELLLEKGDFDPNMATHGALTPLMEAKKRPGHGSAVLATFLKSSKILRADKVAIGEQVFLDNIRRPERAALLALVLRKGFAGESHVAHFHSAAAHGQVRIMQLLVRDFAVPVDSKTASGRTALHDTFLRQDLVTAQCLCQLGARPMLRGRHCIPMLHHAVRPGTALLMRALLAGGADPNQIATDGSKRTALHHACAAGDPEKIVALFKHGADPMLRDCEGLTPYYLAACRGKERLVKWLLPPQPRLDVLLQDGPTLLHEACGGVNVPVVKLLLELGCNLEARTRNGETALHVAVAQNELDSVRLLVRAGADLLVEVEDGSTTSLSSGQVGQC